LHQAVAVLKASTLGADQAALALAKLHREARFDTEARQNAEKLASAVRIIEAYGSGLTTLANAHDVATLDANATALATSLDGALNAYDSTGGPAIGTSGVNIFLGAAAAVSGLLLESRRVAYVKEYVRAADLLIQRLAGGSGEIVKLLNDLRNHAAIDTRAIDQAYAVHFRPAPGDDPGRSPAARPASPRLSAAELDVFQTAIKRSSEVTTHVDAALKATAAIAKLHAGLKKAMDEGVTVEGLVAEGEAVAGQIQVGVKIGEGPKDGGGPTDAGAASDSGVVP
jgi:hypothetical protein